MITTVIGKSNVGKSSFFNSLIGSEISIVTEKKFTTQRCVEIIFKNILFVDTPGLIIKKKNLINKLVYSRLFNSDILVLIVNLELTLEDFFIFEILKKTDKKIFLIISKCDEFNCDIRILNFIEKIKKHFKFYAVFLFSSIKLFNIELIRAFIFNFSLNVDYKFSLFEFVIDIVRKNLLCFLHKEIPHNINIFLSNKNLSFNSSHFLIYLKCEKNEYKKILLAKKKKILNLVIDSVYKDLKSKFYDLKFISIKII